MITQTETPLSIDHRDSGAIFSDDRKHRYLLWRIWDRSQPFVMFIGLNPSTADEVDPDPTIRSVGRIAKHNGYGGILMMNCWSFVTSKPELLQHNPMSDEWNNNMLTLMAGRCKDVVFAWGAFKVIKEKGRDKELEEMFPRAKALFINKDGSPKHPLFCRSNTNLIDWKCK